MASRRIDGRLALDRAGVMALTGAGASTIEYWSHHRGETGFPTPVLDADGRRWWWRDEINTFRATYRQIKAATFTSVDRSGDPNELLTAPQAAKVLGYASRDSITAELMSRADKYDDLPSGRVRRYWRRATLWAYADQRADHTSPGRPPISNR